ncbi:MAG: hypothetical protein ETSY1_06155 [Candidatus Entotheonella factor]|uniref:Uncharacterized protein n=1 Tax=Entotheonella factor TaxID=1429438 RepID=W4LUK5_ENTF1|nr:MAG: hypothetical protein ETSY1_06155 [Candidatus Entotheonella factor]
MADDVAVDVEEDDDDDDDDVSVDLLEELLLSDELLSDELLAELVSDVLFVSLLSFFPDLRA